jgi:hypothetical protein
MLNYQRVPGMIASLHSFFDDSAAKDVLSCGHAAEMHKI